MARVHYPMYRLCYRKHDGSVWESDKKITLRQGIEELKKFDRLVVCNQSAVKDILYCYLLPLVDEKPHWDKEKNEFTY